MQVLLSALAIAMGTAAAWHITSSLYGQTAASTLSYPFWLQAIAIAVACTGFVILFNVHGWGRCLCALGGVVTWMAYLLCGELGLGPYGANFIAAAVAAVYAEGMARARKYPVTSYQVISAVPLLPGAGIYYTMSLGLNGSTQLALQRGFATAGIAGQHRRRDPARLIRRPPVHRAAEKIRQYKAKGRHALRIFPLSFLRAVE